MPRRTTALLPGRGAGLLVLAAGTTALLLALLLSLSPQHVRAAGDPVIAGAGDVACDPGNSNYNGGNGTSNACREKYTSDLLLTIGPSAVFNLGDNQYYCGSLSAYQTSYGSTWGREKSITHPSIGNHEYLTSGGTGCDGTNAGAAGYFNYFRTAGTGVSGKGYYSYDIGSWHMIALNSNCSDAGGCSATSPQGQWLSADLAAHKAACTLAYWHIPLFSSGGRANANSLPFWQALYSAHADVVLNGHDHIYERFAPQNPNGNLDTAKGIREFIAGTGGANHTSIASVAANSIVRDTSTFGVLELTLHATSYDWRFVPDTGSGSFADSGSASCHGSGSSSTTDTAPPSIPVNLSAQAVSSSQINLSWSASTDNVGVTGYHVFRDGGGTAIATVTSGTSYPDAALVAGSNHSYNVSALDAAGNESAKSSPASATTSSGSSTSTTATFTPGADAYVGSDSATTNRGTSTSIRVDGSPTVRSYLKFSLNGLSGAVTRATLRVYANSRQSTGYDVFSVPDTSWTELGITFNNAPALAGTKTGSSGRITAGTWTTVDVTPLVTGNGTFSIALTTTSSTAVNLSSREGANPPQLVVTTG